MFLPCHCTPIILVTITSLLTGTTCAENGVLRRRVRGGASDDSKPPDFHAKTVDTDLASKLANMRLGSYNRLRRQVKNNRIKRLSSLKPWQTIQTESEIKTNAEAAEVDSAVAAIQAEEAKESALNAFKENEKIEQFIQSNNGGKSSKQTSSQSSFSSSSSQGQSSSKNQEKQEDEYEDEDDDDDEAQETIVEDETVRVKIDTSDKKVGHKQGNGTSSNATVGNIAGVGVCQGLLDLKRMTDDFRERLQALVQRQEQAVEKLERISNNPTKQLGTSSSNSDAEPSRACVFIEEHIKSVGNSQAQKSQQSKGQSEREKGNSSGKIHIYTSEGVLPNAPERSETQSSERKGSQRAEGFQRYNSNSNDNGFQRQDRMEETGRQTQSGSRRGPLPIFEGRILPSHNAQQSRNSRDASQFAQNNRFKVARSPENMVDSEKENDHEQDIELEKIIWLKPGTTSVDGEEKVEQGDYDKYKNAVSEIMDQGYDVLIIPISRKFTKAKDVAYSLLDVMRGKKAEKSKTRRFRMTIKRF